MGKETLNWKRLQGTNIKLWKYGLKYLHKCYDTLAYNHDYNTCTYSIIMFIYWLVETKQNLYFSELYKRAVD